MPTTKAPRASLAQVNIVLGLLNVPVDLVPAQRSKRSKENDRPTLSNICPVCAEPTKLAQKLYCSADPEHGPFTSNEAAKAVTVDGELVRVAAEDVVAVKQPDVESHTLELSAFPAGQVDEHTLPSGNVFRVRLKKPSTTVAEGVSALQALVATRPDVAFIGEVVLKGVSKLYRARVWQGDLVFMELVRPGEFYLPEALALPELDERHLRTGEALVDSLVEDFDPQAWNSRAEERLERLRSGAAGPAAEEDLPDAEATAAAGDLLTLLERSVATAA